jgi:hypothetical protein
VAYPNARQKSPKALRKKAAAGQDISEERALIRVGRANTRLLTGQEDLSAWDDEELLRGMKRDRNGKFTGRPPDVVPTVVHREITRRQMSRAAELLRDNVVAAVEVLVELIQGADTEDKDKLKAIEIIMDRVMGKAPVHVDIDVTQSQFDEAVAEVLVDRDDIIDVASKEADE